MSTLLPVTVGAIIVPATASAGFNPAFAVSRPVATCIQEVAIDADGDAVFAWQSFDTERSKFRVEARRRSADGVFGPLHVLSGRSVIGLSHRLAVDAGGNALVAWTLRPEAGPDHAQFRALSASDTLGPIENLANRLPADFARLATNGAGETVFVWRRRNDSQSTSVIEARARSAAGVLGPIQRLSFAGQQTFFPEAALSANGEAVFTWMRRFGSQLVVQARRRSAAGEFAQMHGNLDVGDQPQVAIDRDGHAIVTWVDLRTPQRVQMRTLSATNALGPRQLVSQGTGTASAPVQIAMNAAGDAVFGFRQADGSGEASAKVRARSSAGVFSPSRTLSEESTAGSLIAAGIDARGRSLFAWARVDVTLRVQARRRRPTGGLGTVETLSPPGNAASPRIAMNARGDAVISWCQQDEAGKIRVFGATFSP
jgi:hypothetical protein